MQLCAMSNVRWLRQVALGRKRSRGMASTLLTFQPVNRALQNVHQARRPAATWACAGLGSTHRGHRHIADT